MHTYIIYITSTDNASFEMFEDDVTPELCGRHCEGGSSGSSSTATTRASSASMSGFMTRTTCIERKRMSERKHRHAFKIHTGRAKIEGVVTDGADLLRPLQPCDMVAHATPEGCNGSGESLVNAVAKLQKNENCVHSSRCTNLTAGASAGNEIVVLQLTHVKSRLDVSRAPLRCTGGKTVLKPHRPHWTFCTCMGNIRFVVQFGHVRWDTGGGEQDG